MPTWRPGDGGTHSPSGGHQDRPVSGDLLIAFTSGSPAGAGGDPSVFQGPDGQSSWANGWVMRLVSRRKGFHLAHGGHRGTPGARWLGSPIRTIRAGQQGQPLDRTDRSMKASAAMCSATTAVGSFPGAAREEQAACFAMGPMECEVRGVCLDQARLRCFWRCSIPVR
ncbi:MAG: hypothetical protein CM15mP77_3740 [Synechococcus sp.]|nr:MAG: hypothetical protein CM15mP77_3740 [Synechococcus sp.]